FELPQTTIDIGNDSRLRFFREGGSEQAAESRMQIRAEAQRFLQACAFDGAISRLECRNIGMVADILENCRVLRDDSAGLYFQRRNRAARIDREIVVAVSRLLGLDVHGFQLIRQACFAQDDVGCERTGTSLVIKFHENLPSVSMKDIYQIRPARNKPGITFLCVTPIFEISS